MNRSNVHPDLIHDFEVQNGTLKENCSHRCPTCNLPCTSKKGIAIHCSRVHKQEKEQDCKARLADETAKKEKLVKEQKLRPKVKCEEEELKNVFSFPYTWGQPSQQTPIRYMTSS